MSYLIVAGVMLQLFAEPVIHLFSRDPEVVRYGVSGLRYITCGWPFFRGRLCFCRPLTARATR